MSSPTNMTHRGDTKSHQQGESSVGGRAARKRVALVSATQPPRPGEKALGPALAHAEGDSQEAAGETTGGSSAKGGGTQGRCALVDAFADALGM